MLHEQTLEFVSGVVVKAIVLGVASLELYRRELQESVKLEIVAFIIGHARHTMFPDTDICAPRLSFRLQCRSGP